MAIECLAEVINARKAPWSKGDLLVLLMMANYADPDGSNIFPSVERLSMACRLKLRATQMCIQNLLQDTVLVMVHPANTNGRRTAEYRIDMERLGMFKGCATCGGVACGDGGCGPKATPAKTAGVNDPQPRQKMRGTPAKKEGGPPQKPAAVIKTTRHLPVIDSYGHGAAPLPVDKSGDPVLWEKARAGLDPKAFAKLAAYGTTLEQAGDGAALVSLPTMVLLSIARRMEGELRRALGVPVQFYCGGAKPC